MQRPYTNKNRLLFIAVPFFMSSFFCTSANAQTTASHPSIHSKITQVLVDKIIETCRIDEYLTDYCMAKVTEFAGEHNWDKPKTDSTLNSIDFRHYRSTIDDFFSSYSEETLRHLLTALEVMMKDGKANGPVMLINGMTQANLDLFCDRIIEGRYIGLGEPDLKKQPEETP